MDLTIQIHNLEQYTLNRLQKQDRLCLRRTSNHLFQRLIASIYFLCFQSCSFDGPLEQPVKHSLSKMKQPPLLRMKPCVVKVYKSLIDYEYHDKVYPIFKQMSFTYFRIYLCVSIHLSKISYTSGYSCLVLFMRCCSILRSPVS